MGVLGVSRVMGVVEAVRGPQKATTQVGRLTDGGVMGETGLLGVAAQQGRLETVLELRF
jgi:hypothetical protein